MITECLSDLHRAEAHRPDKGCTAPPNLLAERLLVAVFLDFFDDVGR